MKKKSLPKPEEPFRQCVNIRSRKHPDIRCPLSATQGEFCARHSKNPIRLCEKPKHETSHITETQIRAAKRVQKIWVSFRNRQRSRTQGPAACYPELADNTNEIYTLGQTMEIPQMYRWSYADQKKHIWVFDIRSLHMMRLQNQRENPYTREPFTERAEQSFQERSAYLRKKKYCLLYTDETELTPQQLWHQRILDVTMKYDMLGYYTCLNWFEDLKDKDCALLYTELWELWNFRLQLPAIQKKRVVPDWNNPDSLLFKWIPTEIKQKRDRKWWQKTILDLMDRFVSAADKESRSLGALYGMTAFAMASSTVRQHYSWLVQDLSGF